MVLVMWGQSGDAGTVSPNAHGFDDGEHTVDDIRLVMRLVFPEKIGRSFR